MALAGWDSVVSTLAVSLAEGVWSKAARGAGALSRTNSRDVDSGCAL